MHKKYFSNTFRAWRLNHALPPLLCLGLAACGGGGGSSGSGSDTPSPPPASGLSAAASLGKQIFSDTALSASGQQSCATCHVARFAFAADPSPSGPDRGLPVAIGGPAMDSPGFRNTPTLLYLSFSPGFHFDSEGNPSGGFFPDGRAATLADQATAPFLNPIEMANADAAALIARLRTRPYLAEFQALYGAAVLDEPEAALQRIGAALAAFEREDEQFHPFTSKYDAWLRGQASLTTQERLGLALFNDPTRGNCAGCHPSSTADGRTLPLFTDFSYDNLGVPRNSSIPANNPANAPAYTPVNSNDGVQAYYDLGICGPFRDDPGRNLSGICGQFKVPTLRNVAITAPYFHNGRFATLADAIGFYVRRDTNPGEFYPTTAGGMVTKFDDLPAAYGGQFVVQQGVPGSDAAYHGNVNTGEIPYDRVMGEAPALTSAEINDVIAFLCTLTDGYEPTHPNAQPVPAQCQAAARAFVPP